MEGAGGLSLLHEDPMSPFGPWRHIVDLLFNQGGVSERACRRIGGIARTHAALAELFLFEFPVDLKLAIEIPAHAGFSEESTEAMALARRFHFDSSRASCLRPSGVRR